MKKRKTVENKFFKNLKKKDKAIQDAIWLVYRRYWSPWAVCNRWKLWASDEFRQHMMEKYPWDPNPIMTMIQKRTGKTSKFVSLYRYWKTDILSWAVLSFSPQWTSNYYYMVMDWARINYDEARIIYSYPSILNRLFINNDDKKIENAIDLFINTIIVK